MKKTRRINYSLPCWLVAGFLFIVIFLALPNSAYAADKMQLLTTPEWVYADTLSNGNKLYFTGYGGSSRSLQTSYKNALKAAKREISKYAGAAVAESTVTYLYLFGQDAGSNYDLSVTQYFSRYDPGNDLTVEERWFDHDGGCWVLVSIDVDTLSNDVASLYRKKKLVPPAVNYGCLSFSYDADKHPLELMDPGSELLIAPGYGKGKDLASSIEMAQTAARSLLSEYKGLSFSNSSKMRSGDSEYEQYNNVQSAAVIYGAKQIRMWIEDDGGVWVILSCPRDNVKTQEIDKATYLKNKGAGLFSRLPFSADRTWEYSSYSPSRGYKPAVTVPTPEYNELTDVPGWYTLLGDKNGDHCWASGMDVVNDLYGSYRIAITEAYNSYSSYLGINVQASGSDTIQYINSSTDCRINTYELRNIAFAEGLVCIQLSIPLP